MKYVVMVIIALFVLAACGTGGGQSPSSNFRTGSQALDVKFAANNPNIFYEGDAVNLLLELNNRGTFDIRGGFIALSGFDPNVLPNMRVQASPTFSLEGKSEFFPTGNVQYLTIDSGPVRMSDNRQRQDQRINVVACYTYETRASFQVCVDPDPFNRNVGRKACSLQQVESGAQGHPVAVTSIEPHASSNDIRFNLRIQNVGNGLVYNPTIQPNACGRGLQNTDLGLFHQTKVTLGDISLDCQPENPLRLIGNQPAMLNCVCRGCLSGVSTAYTTTLDVELRYGYRNEISTSIQLVR
ncbi:MAG: hypothetical protein ACMXYC_01900 [Candidatus Woesearchaeota archaeon]